MRLQIVKSWDFNQMLVASVFGHLLLLTVIIFLPKSTYEEIVITPAFTVELVDISTNHKKSARKNRPRNKSIPDPRPEPPPKQMESIKQTLKMPPAPKVKKVPKNSSNKMLDKLNQLNKNKSGVVEELDQLARLVPKVEVKNPVVKKSQPIQEKTFDELNALKNKKVEFTPSNVEPLPNEDPLEQFENLKMKEDLAIESPTPESTDEKKNDTHLEDLEFASFSWDTAGLEKQDEKSAADLLQELAKMESESPVIEEQTENLKPEITVPAPDREKSRAYDPIIQKLESLNYQPKEIKPDIVATQTFPRKFESNIRKVNAPQQVQVEVVVSPSQAFVESPNQGEPSADVLAQYVGLIHEKVYKNWHEPLAENHNKEVIFSFFIYPKGNIDRPELLKSSRVKLLDNLALRAILHSEPFPPFPKEIESQNLNISIHFKYVPEKG